MKSRDMLTKHLNFVVLTLNSKIFELLNSIFNFVFESSKTFELLNSIFNFVFESSKTFELYSKLQAIKIFGHSGIHAIDLLNMIETKFLKSSLFPPSRRGN